MSTSFSSRLSARSQRDYTPVSWIEYFDEAHDILTTDDDVISKDNNSGDDNEHPSNQENSFRVYLKNFKQPYAPERRIGQRLEPDRLEFSADELDQYSNVPTLVALHGGGYSGLTWAQFVKHIQQHCKCRIMAVDLRSHGDTKTSNDDRMDIDTLVSDVIAVTHETHRICGFPETPKIVLVGHSMGGAIAIKCATKCTESLPSLAGFVIIDVVEGTAKDALPLMLSVIKTRPIEFPSLSNAIEWSVRSGMAKNSDAARVSMPGNLVNIFNGQLSIHDVPVTGLNNSSQMSGEQTAAADKISMIEQIKKHRFHVSLEQLIGSGSQASHLLPRAFAPLPPRVTAFKNQTLDGPPFVPLPPVTTISRSSTPTLTLKDPVISELEETQDNPERYTGDCSGTRVELTRSFQSLAAATTAHSETKDDGIDEDGYRRPPNVEKRSGYAWRTNLAKTQPYWSGWFEGLSAQLLNAPVQGKFLLLAGIDRLDKTLTIGQMQGRFMMKVLPKCGHAVHEDVPEQVASAIGDFLVRNKFAMANNDK